MRKRFTLSVQIPSTEVSAKIACLNLKVSEGRGGIDKGSQICTFKRITRQFSGTLKLKEIKTTLVQEIIFSPRICLLPQTLCSHVKWED